MWRTIIFATILALVVVGTLWLIRPADSTARQSFPTLSRESLYYEIPNFLSDDECESLKALASDRGLFKSRVRHGDHDSLDELVRNSEQAWLDRSDSALVKNFTDKCEMITGIPQTNFEQVQVARYPVGGKYDPHYDTFDESDNPRILTVLVYLNDVLQGGETRFPYLEKSVKPEKGKALIFWNTDEKGERLHNSFHGGEPVLQGEKWIANQWIHLTKF